MLTDILDDVDAVWADHIATHYAGCYTRHVGCLAVLVRAVTEDADG